MMSMTQHYENLILDWADKREILKSSTAKHQLAKLLEEYGELVSGYLKGDVAKVKDSIGDCVVVAVIMQGLTDRNAKLFDNFINPANCEKSKMRLEDAVIAPAEHLGRCATFVHGDNPLVRNNLWTDLRQMVRILCNIAYHYETTLDECLRLAYDEIKDRKGIMRDGVFVKVSDLEAQLAELDKRLSEEDFPNAEDSELKRQADELADLIVRANK